MASADSPDFDRSRFKQLERAGFNQIAARYAEAAKARTMLHEDLLDAAELLPGQDVLDLASGPGVLAQAALLRTYSGSRIVASDMAEAMLLESKRHHPGLLHAAADAERLPFPAACFDRVLCGLGLMIFPEEAKALAEIRRVLKPGGRIAVSVWAKAEQVPLVECALACMLRLLPAPKVARLSVFRLGDPEHLKVLFAMAGFRQIRIEPCEFQSEFSNAAEYWQAFLDLAGSAAASLSRMSLETQERLRVEVAHELSPYAEKGGYRLTSQALIATAV
ncbi:MAG: methyltransferase domain-containing protein [Sterolibacterium sp.]|nr:methyltransferase domain-containing protein [Sterolibacterium sp.]